MDRLPLLADEAVVHRSPATVRIAGHRDALRPAVPDRLLPMIGLDRRRALPGVLHVTTRRLFFTAQRVSPVRGRLSVPFALVSGVRRRDRWGVHTIDLSTPIADVTVRTRSAEAAAATDAAWRALLAEPAAAPDWESRVLALLGDWRLGQGLDRVMQAAVRLHALDRDSGQLDRLSAVLVDRLRDPSGGPPYAALND